MNLVPSLSQQPDPSLRRWLLAQLMRIANRNGHPRWYAWKQRLLDFYATRDGFDTQRYEAPCWSCGGTGSNECGECFDCNDGVHHITRAILLRYSIEGLIFHRPHDGRRLSHDDDLDEVEQVEGWTGTRFTARKTSKNTSIAASMEAEAWILLLCGQYRTLWAWLNGAGLAWQFAGYPLLTLRWLLSRPQTWRHQLRRAWQDWQFSRQDIPF